MTQNLGDHFALFMAGMTCTSTQLQVPISSSELLNCANSLKPSELMLLPVSLAEKAGNLSTVASGPNGMPKMWLSNVCLESNGRDWDWAKVPFTGLDMLSHQ